MTTVVKALIAEDEIHVAADLKRRLARLWPELEVVESVTDGLAASEALDRGGIDVAFLDIKMPGRDGLSVAAAMERPCLVVFVTAFDQFAVKAFEQAAVDYIMKPVTDERLERTVARLKEQAAARAWPAPARLEQLLAAMEQHNRPRERLKWVRASLGGSVRLIPVDEVTHFQARDKYTSVWTDGHEYLIRTPLKELKEQLDPQSFWLVHRSYLVNVAHIALAAVDESGEMHVKLRNYTTNIPVARSCAKLFKIM